jgi:hypothetical protein
MRLGFFNFTLEITNAMTSTTAANAYGISMLISNKIPPIIGPIMIPKLV